MTVSQQNILCGLLTASVCFLLFPIIYGVVKKLYFLFFSAKRKRNAVFSKQLLLFSAFLIFSIWCLRFAVGYYSILSAETGTATLTWWEEIFNSFAHALQTFSMDEDYTQYIINGKEMLAFITGDQSVWVTAYGLYASVLNFIAPIAGGAIIFEILASIFPKIKLYISCSAFWKKKYFFSELNAGSLALAVSILEMKYKLFCRPVVVFTDVYTDEENENSSERYTKAKHIGAFCINSDITHFIWRNTSNTEYLFVDENELENIKTFAQLSGEKYYKYLAHSVVRIFYHNDSYVLTEKEIYEQIRNRFKDDIKRKVKSNSGAFIKEKKRIALECGCEFDRVEDDVVFDFMVDEIAPAVLRTRGYQTVIYNLLEKTPLYAPIIDRADAKELDVAIIGNGSFGMEMFLSTYWCGQLLDKHLGINIVSLEDEEEIIAKIDNINSDILLSSVEKNPMLSIYKNGNEFNEPYFTFRYCKADVNLKEHDSIICRRPEHLGETENTKRLIDSDYYLIALGSDEANITAAERLVRSIVVDQLRNKIQKKVVVACIVYNQHLCNIMNSQNNMMSPNVELVAIGGLDDVYSFKNIFSESMRSETYNLDNVHRKMSRSELVRQSNTRTKKMYDYWSSRAREVHSEYKLFSVYSYKTENENLSMMWSEWKSKYGKTWCTKDDKLRSCMGWLEHRRWNAYMRSLGFKFRDDYGEKNVILRLHPCLVESALPDVKSDLPDHLDYISAVHGQNYKVYDLPEIYNQASEQEN